MTDGTSTAVWPAENGIAAPVDYYAYGGLLARRKAEQAEREAERAEARRQAQLEEARDQRATAQYLAGVQPGAAIARALAIQDVETEIATRQAEIDKLARRRDRLVQEGRDQDEAVSRSYTMVQGPGLASRDGVEGAVQRAQAVARELQTEARIEARVARRGRPFGRGAAVRSDGGDVPCADCLAMGATPEESFLIHSDPQPVPVPDDGERSARPGREITRIVEGGRMGQESDLNGRLIYR